MVTSHHQVLAVVENIASGGIQVRAGAATGFVTGFVKRNVSVTMLEKVYRRRKAAYTSTDNRYFRISQWVFLKDRNDRKDAKVQLVR